MTSPNTTISLGVDTSNHVTIDVNTIAESQVSGLATDLSTRPTGSGNAGSLALWSGTGTGTSSALTSSSVRDDGAGNITTTSVFRMNTTNGNAAWFGATYDEGLIVANANPVTGAFVDTGKYAAAVDVLGSASDSQIRFMTASAPNTVPTVKASIDKNGYFYSQNISTTPTASYIPKADTAHKLDPGWLPSSTTTAPGIVQLGATGGAQPTITCPQGKVLQGGTSNATGTGTATNTTTTQTCQNPSWATSTGTGLGTSTQGAVLYNGSTATGTNTSSSPVWGAPPAAGPPLSTSIPPSLGNFGNTGQVGTSTSAMRADAIAPLPPLPVASTVFQGICNYGSTAGTCVQGNDSRLANHLNGIYSASNAGNVTCSMSYTPSTLASVSTSGLASTLVILGAVSAESYSTGVTCPCYVSLWIDSTQIGPLMRATAFLGSSQYVSMSPVARVSAGAGGHVVSLDLGSTEGCACTVDAGNSMLVVTEYTN
jgi:hypothetical protein